jgi:L-gulono-1,4-lactone dehydrogenase
MSTAVAWQNWAGNQRCRPARVATPRSVDEVAAEVKAAAADGLAVKPVGSGHSFTPAAVTDGIQLRLDHLSGVRATDGHRVNVGAGMTLAALNGVLAERGLAMPNLGDIDAQTVAGALATGTHGTGAGYGCLSTFVESMELVTGTGDMITCSAAERPDVFAAARVGLGALGVVTAVTLRCTDAFVLRADERPMPLAATLDQFPDLAAANDHVEFYWMPYTERTLVKRNNRVPADDAPLSRLRRWWETDFLQNAAYGAVCRTGRALPRLAPGLLHATTRMFSPLVYTARSDRVFVTPRRIRFVELEYGLPRDALPAAFAALRSIVDGLPFPVLLPVEVRVTAADDIWLSHGYGRDSVYIAIHQYPGLPYEPYFRAFERFCSTVDGRPHWGKLHWRDADSLRPAYPRFDDFRAVRDRLDPARVLANAYVQRVLG